MFELAYLLTKNIKFISLITIIPLLIINEVRYYIQYNIFVLIKGKGKKKRLIEQKKNPIQNISDKKKKFISKGII